VLNPNLHPAAAPRLLTTIRRQIRGTGQRRCPRILRGAAPRLARVRGRDLVGPRSGRGWAVDRTIAARRCGAEPPFADAVRTRAVPRLNRWACPSVRDGTSGPATRKGRRFRDCARQDVRCDRAMARRSRAYRKVAASGCRHAAAVRRPRRHRGISVQRADAWTEQARTALPTRALTRCRWTTATLRGQSHRAGSRAGRLRESLEQQARRRQARHLHDWAQTLPHRRHLALAPSAPPADFGSFLRFAAARARQTG
jgi:hypothetical protein